jgi:hypothetical protein
VTLSASGWSKLAGHWNPHGPDGDPNARGDSRLLAPGCPYNAALGRWMSIDADRYSPWFVIGSGITSSPSFDAWLVFTINDSHGDFDNNEGSMEAWVTVALKDPLYPLLHAAMMAPLTTEFVHETPTSLEAQMLGSSACSA